MPQYLYESYQMKENFQNLYSYFDFANNGVSEYEKDKAQALHFMGDQNVRELSRILLDIYCLAKHHHDYLIKHLLASEADYDKLQFSVKKLSPEELVKCELVEAAVQEQSQIKSSAVSSTTQVLKSMPHKLAAEHGSDLLPPTERQGLVVAPIFFIDDYFLAAKSCAATPKREVDGMKPISRCAYPSLMAR